MKRIIFCFAAAAALAACSKDNTVLPESGDDRLVLNFDAGTQETETDAVSRGGYDGAKSVWHAGDEVGLTFGPDNSNLHFMQEDGSLSSDGTRVRYTGTLNTALSGAVTCVAYYPYASSVSVTGQAVTTTFPAVQNYVAAGYKGIPLFAKYAGDYGALNLQFRNLFSVVKLTLSKGSALSGTVNLQQVEFKGNNNETVSGAMIVDMSGATPAVSYTGTGKTTALDLGAGVELTAAPKTFYIAVPALDYTKGYTFTFVTDKGQVSKSAKNSGASYAANKVYAAPALTIDNLSIVTTIPDGNLRNALQNLGIISVLDAVSGKVSITSAGLTATSLDVSGKNIASLAGLDRFPALVTLKAANNNLVSADLSKLTLLTNLDLSGNQLSGLNLSANTALLSLNLASNQLSSLDVSANTLLTSLNVSSNGLTSLNLAANPALLSLDVSSNLLTSLDLSKNILLTSAACYGNNLVTLDISGLKVLVTLRLVNASSNAINTVAKSLTIPAAATVQNLVSNGVALSGWLSFTCTGNPNIKTVSLQNCVGLLHVTVTNNAALTSLNVTGSALTTLGVTRSGNASGFTVTGLIL